MFFPLVQVMCLFSHIEWASYKLVLCGYPEMCCLTSLRTKGFITLFGFLCFQKHKNAFACYHCGALERSLLLILFTRPPDMLCSPCCDVSLLLLQYSVPVTHKGIKEGAQTYGLPLKNWPFTVNKPELTLDSYSAGKGLAQNVVVSSIYSCL